MNLKDYSKIAKYGDIIETACPGHLKFVLGICPGVWISTMWVEQDGNSYKARECHSDTITNLDLEIKIIKNNKTTMKITNLVKKILDADTRKLIKAGFINGDLALTDEGISELMGILFLANKEELLKVADEKIKDNSK
ncbi:TPA: hypothetical protein DIU22_03700 [Candidatus Woesebacteria bacterium]|nr:hypothetical protein [Candidatus Woesebacteria bacterium]